MERDFLGLNSKEPSVPVKREIPDEGPDAQWQFMRNASSHPHFMSLRGGASNGDVTRRMVSNSFDHGERTSAGEFQNTSLSLSNPISRHNFTSNGNLGGANAWQQFLGIPTTVSSPVGPVVGFTDPWKKQSLVGPAQMTIFYAGSVSVYDGISPEKAQAIMLLAGNGAAIASNTASAGPQSLSPTFADAGTPNQPLSSRTGPGLTNQLSMSSHPTVQNGGVPVKNDEPVVTKATGVSASVVKQEPQTAVASRGQTPVPVLTTSAVPQFRKASLARFLEKRKERVMSTGPYSCDKKPQEGHTASNNNPGSAANSAAVKQFA